MNRSPPRPQPEPSARQRGRLRGYLVSQFQRPRGPLGHVAGWILASRPSNRARNRWTVELLGIQPTDRVLELGFGPGLSIGLASRLASQGQVIGVDHSEAMTAVAVRRNRAAIDEGRVRLACGSFSELRDLALGGTFDRIFAVNALQFSEDPDALVGDLVDLLRPGGTLAITFQSRRPGATDEDSRRAGEARAASLRAAGLEEVRVEVLPLAPVCAVCALGRRPPAAKR